MAAEVAAVQVATPSKGQLSPEFLAKAAKAAAALPIAQIAQPDMPQGMRKPCKDCYRKHLLQAKILLDEALKGYPEHIWLAIGHLSEAEDEVVGDDIMLANATRDLRLQIMANPFARPELIPLLHASLKGDEKWAAWSNPQK